MRTLVVLLLLGGTCTAAPVSSSYTCVQGHEQAAANKMQDYIRRAATRFFRSRRIAIDPSMIQVNVNLAMQTGADRPYAGFTGSAGAAFAANLSADIMAASANSTSAAGSTSVPGASSAPGATSIPGSTSLSGPAAAGPTARPGTAGRPSAAAGASAGASPGGVPGSAGSAAAYVGGGFGLGLGMGGSAPAATLTAKDGTRFEILFSSGSDIQDTGAYRVNATQRGFTREGNPIGRHCRLRLFRPGDFNATRTLLVINANSGHTLGLIPLPSQISVY